MLGSQGMRAFPDKKIHDVKLHLRMTACIQDEYIIYTYVTVCPRSSQLIKNFIVHANTYLHTRSIYAQCYH